MTLHYSHREYLFNCKFDKLNYFANVSNIMQDSDITGKMQCFLVMGENNGISLTGFKFQSFHKFSLCTIIHDISVMKQRNKATVFLLKYSFSYSSAYRHQQATFFLSISVGEWRNFILSPLKKRRKELLVEFTNGK